MTVQGTGAMNMAHSAPAAKQLALLKVNLTSRGLQISNSVILPMGRRLGF
jgi:hypothetical protein